VRKNALVAFGLASGAAAELSCVFQSVHQWQQHEYSNMRVLDTKMSIEALKLDGPVTDAEAELLIDRSGLPVRGQQSARQFVYKWTGEQFKPLAD
jgi:hypothetical protein